MTGLARAALIVLSLTIAGCSGKKVASEEEAMNALAGETFEFKDETGIPYGIPVAVHRISFSDDGKRCTHSSRLITQDEFDDDFDGDAAFAVKRYIDTGEPYVQLRCGAKGYSYIVASANTLSVYSFGQSKPFSRASRL